MNNENVQRLLTEAGYYKGGLDGEYGPKMQVAVDMLIGKHKELCSSSPASWSTKRRIIGAAQIILHFAGFEPGAIDGYAGHNTEEAYRAWSYEKDTYKKEVLLRQPIVPDTAKSVIWPKQSDCPSYYGNPSQGEAYMRSFLVTVDTPFSMRLDWNRNKKINKITIHKRCANSLSQVLEEVARAYTQEELTNLGLDLFAGSFNYRKMRGGTSWSMHAYGCAIDFNAGPNGLRTRCPQALFCKPEYKKFFDIWENHGWVSLGRAIGRDWMHVQAARL